MIKLIILILLVCGLAILAYVFWGPVIKLIIMMYLIICLVVLAYGIWAYTSENGPGNDPRHATRRRGDRAMTGAVAGTDREQVVRWMVERQSVFEGIHRILGECDQFQRAAEAAQQECERLRHESEQLRAEVSRLATETERVQRERAETAEWLTTMLNEAASRLRIERPPA